MAYETNAVIFGQPALDVVIACRPPSLQSSNTEENRVIFTFERRIIPYIRPDAMVQIVYTTNARQTSCLQNDGAVLIVNSENGWQDVNWWLNYWRYFYFQRDYLVPRWAVRGIVMNR